MKESLRLLFLIALLPVTGCVPVSDNDLPSKHLHDDVRVVGEFYQTDGRRRLDATITKEEGKTGSYELVDSDGKKIRFRIFKIGDVEYASARLTNYETGVEDGGFLFARVKFSPTQLVVEPLDEKWLIANPKALPGTVFSLTGLPSTTRIKTSSEKLEYFLLLQSDSKTLFDVDHPLRYNRAGT